ncbi:MAG: asparaginase domain-containing protein [Gammaproteobacteria bacterium]
MKILLVFTGGTIGSQLKDGTIDTDQASAFKLLQLFEQNHCGHVPIQFKTLQPIQILSENLHPRIWQTIIASIEAENLSEFDGIVVTHGTDTLAFTAAALGIYFNKLDIPLLLVSSDLPLDNANANGLKNFICAVDYIRQKRGAGVFVSYQNPCGNMQIHIATRLSSCLPLSSNFISVQNKAYMSYENGNFQQHHELTAATHSHYKLENRFARILLIRPYPGLNYANYNFDGIHAVLHDLYHSGTACATSQWGLSYSLSAFSEFCRERSIPLYLAPSIKSSACYATTEDLIENGAMMIWNTSLEAAFAKLALAYANFSDPKDIEHFLEDNLAHEQILNEG